MIRRNLKETIGKMERVFRRDGRVFRHFVLLLAVMVVFTTTYSLVLPALTIDTQTADETPGIELEKKEEAGSGDEAVSDENEEEKDAENASSKSSKKTGASRKSGKSKKQEKQQDFDDLFEAGNVLEIESSTPDDTVQDAAENRDEEIDLTEQKADPELKDDKADTDDQKDTKKEEEKETQGADQENEKGEALKTSASPVKLSRMLTDGTGLWAKNSAGGWEIITEDTALSRKETLIVRLAYEIPQGTLSEKNAKVTYKLPRKLPVNKASVKLANDPDNHLNQVIEGVRLPGEERADDEEEYLAGTYKLDKTLTGRYQLKIAFNEYSIAENADSDICGWLMFYMKDARLSADKKGKGSITFSKEAANGKELKTEYTILSDREAVSDIQKEITEAFETEPAADAETETEASTETAGASETLEAGSETETEIVAGTEEANAVLDMEKESETETESETEIAAGTETESESETETEGETEVETESESETETETETNETDAQPDKTMLRASGDSYEVTVNYDEKAEIPAGAELRVTEFAEDSEEYKLAWDAVVEKKQSEDVSFDEAGFNMMAFDISIFNEDGNEVEPMAPVDVQVTMKTLPEEVVEADAEDTVELQHFVENSEEVVLVTVASAADGNIQTSEDSATAEFQVDSFSTFTVGWNTRTTNNSSTTLRWRGDNPLVARGFLTAYYVDENGNAVSRPSGANVVGATVDYDQFGNNASHTFVIRDDLGKGIANYTYQGAYITDQEGNKQTVTSVKGERQGEVTTITYYNGGDVVISKSYDATNQAIIRHNFDDDGLAMTIVYESNNHTTVHYGYMEDGVFKEFTEQPNPTDTSTSDGWAYLLYDFQGTDEAGLPFTYNYSATYYKTQEVADPTTISADSVAPVLRYNNNAWRYYSTSHGYAGDEVNNNSNWTSVQNNSHLYVVYEKPAIQEGGAPTLASETPVPDDPEILKQSVDNGDGTNTLSLNITGSSSEMEVEKLADVIVILDLSSSMQNNIHNNSSTGNGYASNENSRYYQAKQAVITLANNLYQKNTDSGKELIRMGLVTFAGNAQVRQELTADQNEFMAKVNAITRYEGKGTNWEHAIKKANEMSVDPGRATFVIFITDGEPTTSQSRFALSNNRLRSNIYLAGTNGGGFPRGTTHSVHSDRYDTLHYYLRSGTFGTTSAGDPGQFTENGVTLSGDIINNTAAYDDAKSIVDHNKNFYVIAISQDVGVNALNGILDAAGVPRTHGIPATNQDELTKAFNEIQSQITGLLGWGDIKMTDGITDLTNTVAKAKLTEVDGDFKYYKAAAPEGWADWTAEQKAAYEKGIDYAGKSDNPAGYESWTQEQKDAYQLGKAISFAEWTDEQRAQEGCADAFYDEAEGAVKWNMGSKFMLEAGVTYRVSFICWPTQEAFDWLANLANGTKTWEDVVEAGLNCAYGSTPAGDNPQIRNNGDGTYSICTNKENANTTYKTATKTGNTISTSGDDKTLYFQEVDPMPLNRHKLNVLKEWEATINTAHEASSVIFHLLVGGKYYMEDGSFKTLTKSEAAALEASTEPDVVKPYKLIVGADSTPAAWQAEVDIAPGVIRGEDVLETGHSYSLEEFTSSGTDYFAFNYEFKSRTVRPMNVNAHLKYLVEAEAGDTEPSGGYHSINGRTYYETAPNENPGTKYYEGTLDEDGKGTLKGINSKTSELDITKMVDKGNSNLTESDLDAESFTYRITLDIPAGSDISGITGYCYFEYPDGPNAPFKLFGYQPGETALASDIARFGSEDDSKKIYRSWNTTNARIQNYLMTTHDDGSVTIKMDLTLTRKQVLRFTNLPTGTSYQIEEVYANYYPYATPARSVSGQVPLDGLDGRDFVASNLDAQGYSVTQILEKNSNQEEEDKESHTGTRLISGTISETDTRYYNQFTNRLENVALGELKVTKHLEGYEWSGESYYFKLTAGTATYTDGTSPENGISPMPASDFIYLSNATGTADKTYTFGKIRYLRPGTYQYTIAETDADGNVLSGTTGENGIVYAAAETVTVTVGYDADGHLVVEKIEGSNGNTVWSPVDSSAVIAGTTTFTNSLLSVPIRKVDIDKKTQLSDAIFELMSEHSKLYFNSEYRILTAAQVEAIIEMSIGDENAAAAMAAKGITSTFTIGEITLKGLTLNTTYTLKELQSPEGYIIAANDMTFTLTKVSKGIKVSVTGDNASVDEDGITILITNEPGAALPNTGGIGTTLIYLIGILLVVLAGAGLIMRKRNDNTWFYEAG